MNASTRSAGQLLEAAVVLDDHKSVERAREFMRGVMANSVRVDEAFLAAADLIYRPPRFPGWFGVREVEKAARPTDPPGD